jgi:hypothetical protein
LGTGQEKPAQANRRAQPAPVRCPFCVQDDEFKEMVDLTGGAGGTFYCTTCRHLVRVGEPEFRCLCAHCRELNAVGT